MTSDTIKTVLIISSTPYHFTRQASHHLAEQFTRRGWRLVFVDPPAKRFPRFTEIGRIWGRIRGDSVAAGITRQEVAEGMIHVLPLTLPDRGPLLRWVNRHVLLPRLAQQIRTHIDPVTLCVALLPTHGVRDLMALVQPYKTAYVCLLNFPRDPLAPPDIAETERALAQEVDLLMVDQGLDNLERMAAIERKGARGSITSVVEYERFAPARQPIPVRTPPVCCYFGDVRDNIDIALLAKVSERFPLHVIGTNTHRQYGNEANLHRFSQLTTDAMIQRLAEVDIILLPYREDDPYNRGVFPAKVYQTLATGKPVIACGLESIAPLGHVIDIAHGHDEFLTLIDRAAAALASPEAADRRADRLAAAQSADTSIVYAGVFAAIDALFSSPDDRFAADAGASARR